VQRDRKGDKEATSRYTHNLGFRLPIYWRKKENHERDTANLQMEESQRLDSS
jgi:hypothetical protein